VLVPSPLYLLFFSPSLFSTFWTLWGTPRGCFADRLFCGWSRLAESFFGSPFHCFLRFPFFFMTFFSPTRDGIPPAAADAPFRNFAPQAMSSFRRVLFLLGTSAFSCVFPLDPQRFRAGRKYFDSRSRRPSFLGLWDRSGAPPPPLFQNLVLQLGTQKSEKEGMLRRGTKTLRAADLP